MHTRHEFGGFWTQAKLERVAAYLPLFAGEMGSDFRTVYFDAFAGNGAVDRHEPKSAGLKGFFPLPDVPSIDGSATRALKTLPRFDRYVFVDHDESHCEQLKRVRDTFPDLAGQIKVRRGDANQAVANFCKATDWSSWRAVFFLDPYGMAVNWNTIANIAETRAADMWYLFPISATLRMLQCQDKPPNSRRRALDRLFGERDCCSQFYHTWKQNGLISGPQLVTTRHANEKSIINYFVQRLESVFSWVSARPLRLFNTNGSSLFHLYFASSIPGQRPIYEMVKDILRISSGARDFPARFENMRADRQTGSS